MRTLLFVILMGGVLHAQELLPELAPHAQSHKTAVNMLADQKAAEVARIRQPYLTALTTADQTATAAGNVTAVSAISKEREAVEKGGVGGELPAGLPKNLATSRKTMMNGLERLETDFEKRQKVVDAAYLRILGTLQPKAASNAVLAKQIASEKARMLSGISGPVSDLRSGLVGTTWRSTDKGDELEFRTDGTVNGHWKYEALGRESVKVNWNATKSAVFTLARDGKTLQNSGREWKLVPGATN